MVPISTYMETTSTYMETKLISLLSLKANEPSAGLVLEVNDCSCKSNSCTVSAPARSSSANVPKGLKFDMDDDLEYVLSAALDLEAIGVVVA